MKKKILTLIAVICPVLLFAQGIVFQPLTFDQAVAKAKAENKSVFIDCYTTWCAPCKKLADEVFPLKKAGDYFNPNFISIKIDMEKGDGPELAKKLSVKAYPTLIVVNGDGNIITKLTGNQPIDNIIKKIEEGKKNSFFSAKKRYESGKMNTQEKINYVKILSTASERETAAIIVNELLKKATKKEKLTTEFWTIYGDDKMVHIGNEHFKFILENKKELDNIVGKKLVDAKLFRNYFKGVIGSIYGNIGGGGNILSTEVLEAYKTSVISCDIENSNLVIAQLDLAIARGKNDAQAMAQNIEILIPVISKGDIWSYASSFLKVFEANPEAKDNDAVKKIGKFFMDNTEAEHKNMYKNMFKL